MLNLYIYIYLARIVHGLAYLGPFPDYTVEQWPQRAFDTYAPSIITSFGFGRLVSNAMAAVGLFLQVPVSFAFSWFSDH
jgi:hypothetical protein